MVFKQRYLNRDLNRWYLNRDFKDEIEPDRGKGSKRNWVLDKGKGKILDDKSLSLNTDKSVFWSLESKGHH